METIKELKSEQSRIESKIIGLEKIADISEDARLQIALLEEELIYITTKINKTK